MIQAASADLNRSDKNGPKAQKASKPCTGICHLCLAGRPMYDFEDLCPILFRMLLGFISLPTSHIRLQLSSRCVFVQSRGLQRQHLQVLLELSCHGTRSLASPGFCSTSRIAKKLFTKLMYFTLSASALARHTQLAAWLTCKSIALGLRLT